MAWSFGDGFDLYATPADMINGYWDSGVVTAPTLVAGRFANSQALQMASSAGPMSVTKSSATNDAVHHVVVAFRQTQAISGSSLGAYLELLDGTTAQCTIVFRSDGAILLTSGGPTGTVLDTYTGAFPVVSTWYAFEIEVVINNTTGSWAVRKNGNTSNDHSLGSLNTRGSGNNYANKLTLGMQTTVAAQLMDDLFWRSDASSVAWMGDIRCITRMPTGDSSATFSKSPTNFFVQGNSGVTTAALSANNVRAFPVVATTTGPLASMSFNFSAGITGHAKMALYDATGASGNAGVLLATSAELTNPGAGVNTFSVTSGPTLVRGTTYHIALWSDVSITGIGAAGSSIQTLALTYTTSFPSPLGVAGGGVGSGLYSAGINITPGTNATLVNEAQEDGFTTYVYDSTVNDADFYTIGTITPVPSTIFAVVTRGYMIKSDAGSRTASVRTKSGTTTVSTPTLTLSTSGWQWAYRTDVVDPNTGSAWVGAAVDAITVGPLVVS